MSRYYVDLEFDESQLDAVSSFVDLNESYAFETLLQDFVDDAIKSGFLRHYVEFLHKQMPVPEAVSIGRGSAKNMSSRM